MPDEKLSNSSLPSNNKIPPKIIAREEALTLQLYDTYSSALFSFILKILPDKKKAGDILQSVFVKVHNSIETGIDRRSMFLLLLQMARNEAIEKLIESNSTKIVNNTSGRALGINSSAIQAFLITLPLLEKAILSLLYFRGYSVSEIGALLHLPVQVIEAKMQPALGKLQVLFPAPHKIDPEHL
jgi:RNA polymerase sigma factor (sigma-70 family)